MELDLECLPYGDPILLLVKFLRHTSPHLTSFGFQLSNHHIGPTMRQPYMRVIVTGRKTLRHKVQEPCETIAHRTADR